MERVLEGAKESRDYNDLFSSVVADYGGFPQRLHLGRRCPRPGFRGLLCGRSLPPTELGVEATRSGLSSRTSRPGASWCSTTTAKNPKDVLAGAFYTLSQEVAESDPDQPSTPEPSPHLEPRLFANLFENVLSGQVSIELLKRAMFLRKMDQSLLASSEPLKKLYQSTWGK